MSRRRIAVFGAGAWGTALAQAFSASHEVVLWGRDRGQLEEIARIHENTRYLRGVRLRDTLAVEADFARAAAQAICKQRYLEFGCEGQGAKVKGIPLSVMAEKYAKGELAQQVV